MRAYLARTDLDRRWIARPAQLSERRGGQYLMVWGEVPHWMVTDVELRALLRGLDGRKKLHEVISALAKRFGRDASVVRQELSAVWPELVRSGVVRSVRSEEPSRRTTEVKLENISINVTRRCNLRCKFCYNEFFDTTRDELSVDRMCHLVRSARELLSDRPTLVLLGGEPLLESAKTLALARLGRELKMETIVSTNGLPVTDEFARRAAELHLTVQVSLDGASARTNDAVRGSGVYPKALAGLRKLVSAGVHTILSMVLHHGNVAELDDYFTLALKEGADEARVIPLRRVGLGKTCELEAIPPDEMLKLTVAAIERHPEVRKLLGRDFAGILAQTCSVSAPRVGCGTGLQTFLLDADGSIYPCPNLMQEQFRVGNIRDGFDVRRWFSDTVLKKFRTKTHIESPERSCRKCALRHWCMGGCRGEVFALTGNLVAPSPDCVSYRKAILEMFWLLARKPGLFNLRNGFC